MHDSILSVVGICNDRRRDVLTICSEGVVLKVIGFALVPVRSDRRQRCSWSEESAEIKTLRAESRQFFTKPKAIVMQVHR